MKTQRREAPDPGKGELSFEPSELVPPSAAKGEEPEPSNGWQTRRLGELLREVDVRQADLPKVEADELEVLSLTKNNGLMLQSERFGKRIATEDTSKYKVVREGQIVYNPYVIWEGAVHALRKYPAGLVSPVYPVWETCEPDGGFVDYMLRTPPLIEAYNRVCSGAVNRRRSIREEAFTAIPVTVPGLPERQAIASVLRTVQKAKEACEQVLTATRQLKQSLLHHLFTYGTVPFPQAAHVALKETGIGPMPEHWGTIRLGDTASIGNGSTPKRTEPRYWDGGAIPWLTSAKVHDGTIRHADEFVTKTAREECHLPMVSRGSLVIAITGQGKTLGNAAELELEACVSQHLAYVTFHDTRLLPEFVLAFLRLRYDDLQAIGRGGGSTKGALTCGFLKGFQVPLPPLSEQRDIAAQLAAVDAKLGAEELRRAALAALFQSLLHHLMTGKVRLPEFVTAE